MNDIKQMNLPDVEESTEEEVTQEQIKEQIEDMEEKQEINEALANIPDVFEVNGKKIEIRSKTPRELVQIDKLILRLVKISYERETMSFEDADDKFFDKIESVSERYFDANCDVLVHVMNENPEEPEITKDWILDNMDFSQNGVAEQVMDAYNRRCSPDNFFQKVIRSRKF